ncbi:hypothetical protein LI291_07320 [Intestinibacillus massiliensis]|uniref:hypothetical protein n=1 Tax=Intestinibacillus massiliensis TaxID=1871029 RepID=UPI000B3562CD|nr:hypothetical protein [Intestinibacillus massiliensis]MCB6365978.1 hypothetical protein [Intestinibacillus massiliensis]
MEKRVKRRLTLRGFLSILVVLTIIRQALMGNYENIFTCVLTLLLFCVPIFVDRRLGIDIPPVLEAIIYLFIFAAEILGEIDSFYTRIPYWDTMLHTLNGFLMAAIGIALVDILNRSEKFSFHLSPLFVAVVAFCFSMTVGVLWEFFECFMDLVFHTDMQKDFVITQVNSVLLNPDGLNVVVHEPIHSLVVNGEDWMAKYGGYIDVGLLDTMKDLFVNFIGAVVFSVIGYFYVKNRGRGAFARKFIPTLKRHSGRP